MKNCAYFLIFTVLVLVSLGVVMITSVGAYAPANNGDPYFFLTRHIIRLLIGLVAAAVLVQLDYHQWAKYSWWILGGAALAMLLCVIPGIGVKVNGAYRWLSLGGLRVQPSEFGKLAFVILMASWAGTHLREIKKLKEGILIPGLVLGGMCGLTLLQDDLGSTVMLVLITFLLLFMAGTKWRYIAPVPILGLIGVLVLAFYMPERLERIMAFLDPEKYRYGAGHQPFMALVAFGSGGIDGIGLGNGIQKMAYLPEAHTDFIFPIIGEELGVVITLLVVFGFLVIALSGGYISCHAPDATGLLLGMGATGLICLQAGFNMAVVTSMVPTKGIGLPFISYGGTNIIMCFMCVGILLNIHRQAWYEVGERKSPLPQVMTERM